MIKLKKCLSIVTCLVFILILSSVPLMAAGTSDYVMKISGINRINDGIRYTTDLDLDKSLYTLRFEACALEDTETLYLFESSDMSGSGIGQKIVLSSSWNTFTYNYNYGTPVEIDNFTFSLISWSDDDNHDYYIRNIYLFEYGSDINLLTGTTEPLDFLDFIGSFSPISRDTSKASNATISFVLDNQIVTTGNAEGFVLYTEYTGVDQEDFEFLISDNLIKAVPGSVISKRQNTLGSKITKLFWCNSVRLNLERYCTYRVTFVLSGHVQNCINDQTVLPNGFGSMSISDSLPEKYSDIGNLFNSEDQLYSNFTEANYHQRVSMLDGVANDGKEDTFVYEYIFSTADGCIDNFNSGTYYVNFLNLDSDWLTEYDVNFIGVSVESVVDPNSEYFEQLVIQDLSDRASELGFIGAQSSKSENWSLDKADEIRKEAQSGMTENLDIAKSFLSGSSFARGGGVQGAAVAFVDLYNTVVSTVPAELQALIVIIPTLAFIGWVIGRLQ